MLDVSFNENLVRDVMFKTLVQKDECSARNTIKEFLKQSEIKDGLKITYQKSGNEKIVVVPASNFISRIYREIIQTNWLQYNDFFLKEHYYD